MELCCAGGGPDASGEAGDRHAAEGRVGHSVCSLSPAGPGQSLPVSGQGVGWLADCSVSCH